jgi:hypothetical protein
MSSSMTSSTANCLLGILPLEKMKSKTMNDSGSKVTKTQQENFHSVFGTRKNQSIIFETSRVHAGQHVVCYVDPS